MPACEICSTALTTRAGSRYCSPACRQKAYRYRVTGDNPPNHRYVNNDVNRSGSHATSGVQGKPSVTFASHVPVPVTFAAELLFELEKHARRGGTAIGAVQVARRVAREHNLPGMKFAPLPHWTRAEYEDLDPALRSKRR